MVSYKETLFKMGTKNSLEKDNYGYKFGLQLLLAEKRTRPDKANSTYQWKVEITKSKPFPKRNYKIF